MQNVIDIYLKGMIILWSGTEDTIPDGWALCDGNNGTPNLAIQFVMGSWGLGASGVTGGAAQHTHPFTGDGHSHSIVPGIGLVTGVNASLQTSSDPAIGTTDPGTNLPPFYVLAYIMKL